METKSIFSLYLTREEALNAAREYKENNKTAEDGSELVLWEDPHGFYGERLTIRTDELQDFDRDLPELYKVGHLDGEATALLKWMLKKVPAWDAPHLNQVIVGTFGNNIDGDREIATFAYISRERDCAREFLSEIAFKLTDK